MRKVHSKCIYIPMLYDDSGNIQKNGKPQPISVQPRSGQELRLGIYHTRTPKTAAWHNIVFVGLESYLNFC